MLICRGVLEVFWTSEHIVECSKPSVIVTGIVVLRIPLEG